MNDGVQVFGNDDGYAIVGPQAEVQKFLQKSGLDSVEMDFTRLNQALNVGSAAAQAAAQLAQQSGRWVQLAPDSAKAMREFTLMKGSAADRARMIAMSDGKTAKILEIMTPAALSLNPATLLVLSTYMQQAAIERSMEQILDYLHTIDQKIDDVLRNQKNEVLAQVAGAALTIDEAMTIRDATGRVTETLWNKVQATPNQIDTTMSRALLQLDALAEKVTQYAKDGKFDDNAAQIRQTAIEWLSVIAQCFRLRDAVSVIELDRMLEESPDDLRRYREGLEAARTQRLTNIGSRTENLIARINAAAEEANRKVLLRPFEAKRVVATRNTMISVVSDFDDVLEISRPHDDVAALRWRDGVRDAVDKTKEKGEEAAEKSRKAAAELTANIAEKAGTVAAKASEISEKLNGGQTPGTIE